MEEDEDFKGDAELDAISDLCEEWGTDNYQEALKREKDAYLDYLDKQKV